jgi:hypothetical protein
MQNGKTALDVAETADIIDALNTITGACARACAA